MNRLPRPARRQNGDKPLYLDFCATGALADSPLGYDLMMTVRRAVRATLREENFPYGASVCVTFCDGEYIRQMNRRYRDTDRSTDVLSFPLYMPEEFSRAAKEESDEHGCVALGDVVLNLLRADQQAKEIGQPFLREIAFLTVHSVLHLLGYDHERSVADENLQCEKQKKIIASIEADMPGTDTETPTET